MSEEYTGQAFSDLADEILSCASRLERLELPQPLTDRDLIHVYHAANMLGNVCVIGLRIAANLYEILGTDNYDLHMEGAMLGEEAKDVDMQIERIRTLLETGSLPVEPWELPKDQEKGAAEK